MSFGFGFSLPTLGWQLSGGGASSGYSVTKSLRFRSSASAYLNRTFAAGNRTTWTWSGWIKRGKLGAGGVLFQGYSSIADRSAFQFNSSDQLFFNGIVGILTTAVFRDPAAWYHMVCVYDSTNATASDRVILYVNGVRQTVTGTYPTVSQAEFINGAWLHYLSTGYSGAFEYLDENLAEVNFVDGQALAPTAFGAYSTYNQWLPIAYAGTYGTNGFYLPFTNTTGSSFASYAGSFNGSNQVLNVGSNALFTMGSGDFTAECWCYPTAGLNGGLIFTAQYQSANIWSPGFGIRGSGSGLIWYFNTTSNLATTVSYTSSNGPELNVWSHVAMVVKSGVGYAYLNGVLLNAGGTGGVGTLAASPYGLAIGIFPFTIGTTYFPGYISNVRVTKGTAVYTDSFVVPAAPLTAISGTSLLTLQDATIVDNSGNSLSITNTGTVVTSTQTVATAATPVNLALDSSGNANNWTPNNISLTAGSTYDSLTDVPTLTSTTVANYPVLSPLSTYNGGGTLSNGNLTVSLVDTANNKPTMATDTGKWYAEFTCVSAGGYSGTGLAITTSGASTLYPITLLRTDYANNGQTYSYNASAYVSYGASWTSGDVIGVAWDCSAAQVTFYKNGVSQGAISSPTLSLTTGGTPFSFIPSSYNTAVTSSFSVNYGQQPWKYSIPSGFLPLNTFNI